jgi:[acyl-carrier-protein] S-malonyltransferase
MNTQPVMLTAGIACFRAWLAHTGQTPAFFAGHSLGEYTALVAAGSLTFADALPLVRFRAQAMQDAVLPGTGAMAAVLGLDAGAVREVCVELSVGSAEVVEAVNFNDPKQIVIAGTKAGVDKACELLKTRGAKRAMLLAVSAPFHSSLMKPAAERLKVRLAATAFSAPRIPVVNNVDVQINTDPQAIRDALYRQAFGPVRWVELVQSLRLQGVMSITECGPGKVLAGTVKRIDPELAASNVFDPVSLAAAAAAQGGVS